MPPLGGVVANEYADERVDRLAFDEVGRCVINTHEGKALRGFLETRGESTTTNPKEKFIFAFAERNRKAA